MALDHEDAEFVADELDACAKCGNVWSVDAWSLLCRVCHEAKWAAIAAEGSVKNQEPPAHTVIPPLPDNPALSPAVTEMVEREVAERDEALLASLDNPKGEP